MKTRIIHTRIWKDNYFHSLDRDERLVFLFLITNEGVNMSGIYELVDEEVCLWTGVTKEKLQDIKKTLMLGKKFFFKNGWVKIINHEKYNKYGIGQKQQVAKERELENIPDFIKEIDTSIDTSMHTTPILDLNHKTKRNNIYIRDRDKRGVGREEKEIIKIQPKNYRSLKNIQKEDIQDISDKYQVPISFVKSKLDDLELYCSSKGKRYKNYKSALMNWVKRDALQIKQAHNEKSKIAFINPA